MTTTEETTITVKKTTGFNKPDGAKGYRITLSDGTKHDALRVGSSFESAGFRGTIKEIKQHLISLPPGIDPDQRVWPSDESIIWEPPRKPWESETVDPCAFLVRFIEHGAIHLSETLRETLDAHGAIDPDTGRIDKEWADFEFARVARQSERKGVEYEDATN